MCLVTFGDCPELGSLLVSSLALNLECQKKIQQRVACYPASFCKVPVKNSQNRKVNGSQGPQRRWFREDGGEAWPARCWAGGTVESRQVDTEHVRIGNPDTGDQMEPYVISKANVHVVQ